MADQLALPLDATPPGSCRQRGASSLQRLFRTHFTELVTRYEDEFARRLGKFRLERITKVVERFLGCGDYRRGRRADPVHQPPGRQPRNSARSGRHGERPAITDPPQVLRILRHLIKTTSAPPGLDAASRG